MLKCYCIFMLVLSLFTGLNARQSDEKGNKEKRRARGSQGIKVVKPHLSDGKDEGSKDTKHLSADWSREERQLEHKKERERKAEKKHQQHKLKEEKRAKKLAARKAQKQRDARSAKEARGDQSIEACVTVAHMHYRRAEEEKNKIKRIKERIKVIEGKLKKVDQFEKERVAKTPRAEKHKALLQSRHAETREGKKKADRHCCRIHGTCPHPAKEKLQKVYRRLSCELKARTKSYNKSQGLAAQYYKKAGLTSMCKKLKAEERDQKIINGQAHKRTRKHLSESAAEIAKKRKIEQERKERDEQRKYDKKQIRHKKRLQKV